MATDVSIDTDELSRVLELLKEYTGKLREICEERAASRFRVYQMAGIGTMVIGTAVSMTAAFALRGDSMQADYFLPLAIGSAGMATLFVFIATGFVSQSRFKYWFDAKQVSSTVERLIKTASQYSEHASRRISDKFEFDLRLAEAEAALHMYKKLFDEPI